MPPDQNQNINLLPGDLKRKREVIKKVIADGKIEYTRPQHEKIESLKKEPSKRARFFGWLKRPDKKIKMPAARAANGLKVLPRKFDTPAKPDLKAPSEISNDKAKIKAADALISLKPNFLRQPKKKIGWWSRLFAKKPAAAAVKEAPKPKNIVLPARLNPVSLPPPPPPPLPLPAKTASAAPAVPLPMAPQASQPEKPLNGFTPGQPGGLGPEFDVNLLSKEYAEVFKIKNQKTIFTTSLALAAGLVLFAYLGIHLYQLQQGAKAREAGQINAELAKTIAAYQGLEKEDALLAQRVTVLKSLLSEHISLNKFLGLLESVTTPEVTYVNIAASREGVVSLTALATDYTALGRQLSILQTNTAWIKEARVTSAQLARSSQAKANGVKFDLVLKVDPAVFKGNFSP